MLSSKGHKKYTWKFDTNDNLLYCAELQEYVCISIDRPGAIPFNAERNLFPNPVDHVVIDTFDSTPVSDDKWLRHRVSPSTAGKTYIAVDVFLKPRQSDSTQTASMLHEIQRHIPLLTSILTLVTPIVLIVIYPSASLDTDICTSDVLRALTFPSYSLHWNIMPALSTAEIHCNTATSCIFFTIKDSLHITQEYDCQPRVH